MATAGEAIGDRYRLIEPVASGGMAQVWRARDEVLGRPVAVKILHPHLAGDHAFLVRFRREAVAAARLSHPGIVAIYDTVSEAGGVEAGGVEAGGVEAIVMELVEGPTLRSAFDRQGPLSTSDITRLGLAVADALASAHRAGVVHRDIKPSNIILGAGAEVFDAVKVTDFGIAKAGEDTDLTVTGTLLGTAKYLSPEQVRGEAADPRSDLYSLGVVLFEGITGRPPFLADTDAATALARLHAPAPPVRSTDADVPAALAAVIDRLLAREPGDRFETAAALRLALLAAQSGTDSTTSLDTTTALTADNGAFSGPEVVPAEPTVAAPGTPMAPEQGDGVETEPEDYPGTGRGVVLPALVVILLGASLVVAALLISDSSRPRDDGRGGGLTLPGLGDGDTSTTVLTDVEEVGPPAIGSLVAFDPEGDGTENDARLSAMLDGDVGTVWPSDTYKRENFAGLKGGVGVVAVLEQLSEVSRVEILSPGSDWVVEVYVGEGAKPGDPGSWGDPVALMRAGEPGEPVAQDLVRTGSDGDAHAPIGSWVLLWIIDPGTSPPSASDIARAEADATAEENGDENGEDGTEPGGQDEPAPIEVPPAHRFELAELSVS